MSDCIAASTSNKYVVQYFLYQLNYTFDNKINDLAHFPVLLYSFGSGIYKIKKISVKMVKKNNLAGSTSAYYTTFFMSIDTRVRDGSTL